VFPLPLSVSLETVTYPSSSLSSGELCLLRTSQCLGQGLWWMSYPMAKPCLPCGNDLWAVSGVWLSSLLAAFARNGMQP